MVSSTKITDRHNKTDCHNKTDRHNITDRHNKTDRHNITAIMLKEVLNTVTPLNFKYMIK